MTDHCDTDLAIADEADCEEVFEVLDQYVEAVMRGRDVLRSFARVVAHLRHCADCDEEAASLLAILLTLDLGRWGSSVENRAPKAPRDSP